MSKWKLALWSALILVVIMTAAAIVGYPHWQPWAAEHTGSQNNASTPPNYNFWSGFGSVFPWECGVLVSVALYLYHSMKKANCHVHGCWRIGAYPIGDYTACKRHHTETTGVKPTVELLKLHHDQHQRIREAKANGGLHRYPD